MELKKVKATEEFLNYRNAVLGLPKKDFRALKAGKIVSIPVSLYKKNPGLYKGVKDGD